MRVVAAGLEHPDLPAVPGRRREGEVDRDVMVVAGVDDEHRDADPAEERVEASRAREHPRDAGQARGERRRGPGIGGRSPSERTNATRCPA